ncbi:MAG TPA: glycosyltransferase family 9 protein [Thermoanaerobaculia bacterium]|nr:glycosyltransferase family 9 protein [Thermoanaerobaculia bacterium]
MPETIPVPPLAPDGVIGVPLRAGAEPRRIVVIRFHAFGDAAITFPVLGALRRRLSGARIDVVTDVRSADLFAAHRDVDDVHAFDTRRSKVRKGAALLGIALSLRRRRVPAVLDLQRNRWSMLLTRLLGPGAWAAFDRHAPRTALSRYLDAAEKLGLGRLDPVLAPHGRRESLAEARARLGRAGRDPTRPLVCLNPAGGWETKQWPLPRFAELGRRLAEEGCQLMTLAVAPVPPRFRELRDALGDRLLDFTGTTSPAVALALVSLASLVVSDDSGLMHLAWTQGVPTVALFGASRSVWSRPEGPNSAGYYSEDLDCGACLQPFCARGDLHCLRRVSVEEVLGRCRELLSGGPGPGPAGESG